MPTTNHLCLAVGGCHIRAVRILIEAGARIDGCKVKPDNIASVWDTPLHYAANNGQYTIAKLLIGIDADVNELSYGCVTAIYAACRKGYKNIVELLIEAGANIDRPGGYDLLEEAYLHPDIQELLRRHGAK